MTKEKILIIGSHGVLGRYVQDAFSRYLLLTPSHSDLDIANEESVSVFIERYVPTTVIHIAAITDVDYCEKNPEKAFLVNGEGTKFIAKLCRNHHINLIFVSTAAVFDGSKESYVESDTPAPINIYGKSKLAAENYIQSYVPSSLILRTAWLIGGGTLQKKFVSYIVAKAKSEKEIPVINDVWGTVAYAKDFAEFILKLHQSKEKGIHHFGSNGICSRVDIANAIIELLGSHAKILPVPSSYFTHSFSAPRPIHEVLKSETHPFDTDWKDRLSAYITQEILS